MIALLLRIGLVTRKHDGGIRWPVSVAPWWVWRVYCWPAVGKRDLFCVFRNRPNVVKWIPGRMLPRRWGVRVLGIEIGDRG